MAVGLLDYAGHPRKKTGGAGGTNFIIRWAGWVGVRWGCGGVWVSSGVVGRWRSVGRGRFLSHGILCPPPVGREHVFSSCFIAFYHKTCLPPGGRKFTIRWVGVVVVG